VTALPWLHATHEGNKKNFEYIGSRKFQTVTFYGLQIKGECSEITVEIFLLFSANIREFSHPSVFEGAEYLKIGRHSNFLL